MSIERYHCKICNGYFDLDMIEYNNKNPKFCPYCGNEWITKKTPTEIIEEIKRLYHEQYPGGTVRTPRECRMEKLLNELKEMAEDKTKIKSIYPSYLISSLP